MRRLIYQGKSHCTYVAQAFSIGLDRKFRRSEHRATSIRVNAKSRSTLGDKKDGTREKHPPPSRYEWKIRRPAAYSTFQELLQDPLWARYNSRIFLHRFTRIPRAKREGFYWGEICYNGFPRNWNLTQWIQWRVILIYITLWI